MEITISGNIATLVFAGQNGTRSFTLPAGMWTLTGGVVQSGSGYQYDYQGGNVTITLTNSSGPAPTVPLSANPTPIGIQVNDRVKTTDRVNVRGTACNNGKPAGKQPSGATGKVVAGPSAGCGYTWWKIDFNSGADGWVAQDYLVKPSNRIGRILSSVSRG